MEDKTMIEEVKIILTSRLEEKSSNLTKIANMQLDTLSQMMNANYKLNVKDIEITTLKLQSEKLHNDLKREKEFAKCFNKPNEAIKYFEQLLRSPRSNNDTFGLVYTSTKEGESSKNAKERNTKGKNSNLLVQIVVRKDIL